MQTVRTWVRAMFAFTLLVISMTACDDKTAPCSVSKVNVLPQTSDIARGAQAPLTATVVAENCDATLETSWRSSAANIASVNPVTGVVTGVSVGQALITATIEGTEGSAAVNIIPPPVSSVEITTGGATSVTVGASLQLNAILRDADGLILDSRIINWTVSPPGFASIGATSGLLTGLAVGTVTVTATSEGKSASTTIGVIQAPVSQIAVSVPSPTMQIGATQQATAVLRDAANNILTGRTIFWSSSAPNVLQVNSSTGVITALSAGGAAVIATAEGVSGTAIITVAPTPVASVTVSVPSNTMGVGTTQQATAELRSASNQVLTGRLVTWNSSAQNIVQVSGTGVLTAVALGMATVTATSEGVTGSVVITVTSLVPTLSSIAPFAIDAVFAAVPVTITGTNFSPTGTTVSVNPTNVLPSGIVVQNSTTITGTFGIVGGLPTNIENVTVTTAAGTSNAVQFILFGVGAATPSTSVSSGGPGGTPYLLDCNVANEVATGFDVRAAINLDQIQLRCQPVTTAARTFGAVRTTASAGGAGGVASTLACPVNYVLTGITGRTGLNAATTVIGQIAAICSPINGGAPLTTASVGTVQGGSVAFTATCPPGLVVTSLQGAAATVVDRIAVVCR